MENSVQRICLTVALLGALAATSLRAQQLLPSAASLEGKLRAATRLKCTFTLVASGAWNDGTPQGEVKPASLAMEFVGINADEGTSRMIDRFGTFDVIVKLTSGGLHFIQALRDGALYATSVFAKESNPGMFKAVHSRHEYTDIAVPGFTAQPEQYYGECGVVP
jgi:hypothetical protein